MKLLSLFIFALSHFLGTCILPLSFPLSVFSFHDPIFSHTFHSCIFFFSSTHFLIFFFFFSSPSPFSYLFSCLFTLPVSSLHCSSLFTSLSLFFLSLHFPLILPLSLSLHSFSSHSLSGLILPSFLCALFHLQQRVHDVLHDLHDSLPYRKETCMPHHFLYRVSAQHA